MHKLTVPQYVPVCVPPSPPDWLPMSSVCTEDNAPECPCLPGCLCRLYVQKTVPQCAPVYPVVCALCMYRRQCPSVPLSTWLSLPSVCTENSAPVCPCLPGCLCPLYVQKTMAQFVPVYLVVCAVCMYRRQCPSVSLSNWLSVPSVCTEDSAPVCPCLTGCQRPADSAPMCPSVWRPLLVHVSLKCC